MHTRLSIAALLLGLTILLTTTAATAAEQRIAVAADSDHAEAVISDVAARAPYILIFDNHGQLLESHLNPAVDARSGAGPALARWLAEHQVTLFMAGDIGGKMAPELERLQIRAVTAHGKARMAVQQEMRQ